MNVLGMDDYRLVLDVIGAARCADSRAELARHLVSSIRRLIPADATAYYEANPVCATVTGFIESRRADVGMLRGMILRHIREQKGNADGIGCPVGGDRLTSDWRRGLRWEEASGIACHGAFDAQLLGEPLRGCHEGAGTPINPDTEPHNGCGKGDGDRGLGEGFLINMALPARKPLVAAVAVIRHAEDFTVRDRAVIELLQSHIAITFATMQTATRLQRSLERQQVLLENLPAGVALLHGFGKVEMWTQKARLLLSRYFPGNARPPGALPEELSLWLRGHFSANGDVGAAVLVKRSEQGELTVRLINTSGGQRMLHLLEMPRPGTTGPLEALGLSPRRAQVLLLVARGRTNREIALDLAISPRTVQRHLESVFSKLNVSTRTQACRVAWERLQ